jgi:hypothetical protein
MRYQISTHEIFDEMKYLLANSDVVQAIERNEFKNGHEHFETHGFLEKRFQKISLEKDSPLAVVHVPKCAGTSLRIEIDRITPNVYNGNKYSVRKSKVKFFGLPKSNSAQLDLDATTWSLEELQVAHDQYECVMGHISLRNFEKAGFKDFVMIVREPRIRLLSELIFLKSNPEYESSLKDFGVKSNKTYFDKYARKMSKNVIAQLASTEIIFDWYYQTISVGCYWNAEIPKLMMDVFGQEAQNYRSNISLPQMLDIDFRILDLVHELTEKDSAVLARLMNSGLLSARSKEKMEEEFQSYLLKNFNYVRTLL